MIKKILFIGICILLLASLVGCAEKDPNIVTINGDGSFTAEECQSRGLNDQVIMFESKYCSHCKETLPDFIAACEDYNITPIILDLSEAEQMAQFETYDIEIVGTPTFIFGCNYMVAVKTKEVYLASLDTFLSTQV